jgi:hypothetical protein
MCIYIYTYTYIYIYMYIYTLCMYICWNHLRLAGTVMSFCLGWVFCKMASMFIETTFFQVKSDHKIAFLLSGQKVHQLAWLCIHPRTFSTDIIVESLLIYHKSLSVCVCAPQRNHNEVSNNHSQSLKNFPSGETSVLLMVETSDLRICFASTFWGLLLQRTACLWLMIGALPLKACCLVVWSWAWAPRCLFEVPTRLGFVKATVLQKV